jgi:PiT family inorganic phosphate transporter
MSAVMVLLAVTVAFLAFSNGANDNFKGVASLYGSATATYRTAIVWATGATAAGSLVSIILAEALVRKFTGKGLVDASLVGTAPFLLAVAAGAGITVLLATRLGFPISTTHGLVGAMIGAGLAASGVDGVNFTALGKSFVLPLILGPVLATAVGSGLYLASRSMLRGRALASADQACLCVSAEPAYSVGRGAGGAVVSRTTLIPVVVVEACPAADCVRRQRGGLVGIDLLRLRDAAHFLSAGVVSFARGLNDTPKIAALLLATGALAPKAGILVVAVAIAAGGLIAARRVAETMSHKITDLDPNEGLVSNLGTGALVIMASLFGLPVSTTHVSVGSLFGVGLATGELNGRTMSGIALSWLVTLPCAALCGGLIFLAAGRWGP